MENILDQIDSGIMGAFKPNKYIFVAIIAIKGTTQQEAIDNIDYTKLPEIQNSKEYLFPQHNKVLDLEGLREYDLEDVKVDLTRKDIIFFEIKIHVDYIM